VGRPGRVADLTGRPAVTRLADGAYRVDAEGRSEIVYVARTPSGWWAFVNGQVFQSSVGTPVAGGGRRRAAAGGAAQAVAAPMPATVIKVLVKAGDAVKKGDTVVVLEAMKMELPLRAPADARVEAVHCREGDLVKPDAVLVAFT
jgi:biotin carboxyl carrier protein